MIKKKLGKKGIFYTLGLSLFALVLLFLAILFFRHAESVESRNIELSFSQKNYDLESSISKIFTKAFASKSGTSLSSDTSSLMIKESLPRSFTQLDALMNKSKNNVEGDFNTVSIDLEAFFDNHNLILMPLGITYQCENNKTYIQPNQYITKYNITLAFNKNITSCTSDIGSRGTVDIYFFGQSLGNDCEISWSDVGTAGVNLTVSNGKEVFVSLNSGSALTIESGAVVQNNITIDFNGLDQKTYFQLPITLEINDPAYNFYKKSEIKFPFSS